MIRRINIILTLLLFSFVYSWGEEYKLTRGDSTGFQMELDFNNKAKKSDQWVEYTFGADTNALSITANQGKWVKKKADSKTIRIEAASYENPLVIIIKVKEGAVKGDYPFSFTGEPSAYSSELEENITNPGSEAISQAVPEAIRVPSIPMDPTTKVIIWIIVILVLLGVGFFILKRPWMPLGPKPFLSSRLVFNDPELNAGTIQLKGKESFDFGAIIEGADMKLEPYKKKHKGKVRVLARLKINSPSLDVEVRHNMGTDPATSGYCLFNMDDVTVTVPVANAEPGGKTEKKYSITYFNSKNRR